MARDDETPTRQKVAELIDKGFSVLEIAHHLRISPQAVYKHINRYGLPKPSEVKEKEVPGFYASPEGVQR